MIRLSNCLILLLMVSVASSCNNTPSKEKQGILMGTAKVLVDETIKPIVEDQIDVFHSSYPYADLVLSAGSERDVVTKMLQDSAQLFILARKLNEDELNYFKQKTIVPREVRFATDAIALVVNKSYKDSTITKDEIISIMTGKNSGKSLVFDNANSSTLRYFRSLAGVEKLPERGIYALESNTEVLKFVYENPQTIGVIGVNWLLQPTQDVAELVNEVKVLAVGSQEDSSGKSQYYKPTQSNLALNLYPFTRSLYCINVQGKEAIGMGLSSFLHGERGQKIILKSGLLPDSIFAREILIRKEL